MIRNGDNIGFVEEVHEADGAIMKSAQEPGSHADGPVLDICYMVLEAAVLLEDDPQVFDLGDLLHFLPIRCLVALFLNW